MSIANNIERHAPQLLDVRETAVWGDAAYTGPGKVIEQHAPWAHDFTQHRGSAYKNLSQMHRAVNRKRSNVRARVEHAVVVIKRVFGFAKVCYRGLAVKCQVVFSKFRFSHEPDMN